MHLQQSAFVPGSGRGGARKEEAASINLSMLSIPGLIFDQVGSNKSHKRPQTVDKRHTQAHMMVAIIMMLIVMLMSMSRLVLMSMLMLMLLLLLVVVLMLLLMLVSRLVLMMM